MESYYFVFFIASVLSIFGIGKNREIITFFIIIILVVFAGTRLNIDNDYHMYFKTFQYMDQNTKDFKEREISLEWCMYFIPNFFNIFFDSKLEVVRACFFSFAFLGVTTKLIAIKRYSKFFFLSVIIYIGNLFLMQEMTTIRAGIAAGLFLLSINDLEEKKYKNFAIKVAVCFFFHNSSILFVLAWLLLKVRFEIRLLYIAVVISFISAVVKINILKLLFLDKIFPRVEIYFKMMEWMKENDTNIFNFRIIFAILFLLIFAFYYKKLKSIKYFDTLFRLHIISLCLFFLLSTSAPVFSIRTFELFAGIQILLYPMIIYVFNKKIQFIGWAIIILFSIIQIYYLINVADIYRPYQSWLL